VTDNVPTLSSEDWADEGGRLWSSVADRLEAQLAPVSDVLFAAAEVAPGERILDVGCGRGSTTRRAAEAAGATGTVVGLDIARELIDAARADPSEGAPIEWIVGDAQRANLPTAHFDAVISRFGTLFFDDVTAAFANLARATRAGGRLAIAVWQPRDRSPVLQRPLDVAVVTAAEHGFIIEPPAPDAGPHELGVPSTASGVLDAAGWSDVTFAPHVLALHLFGAGPVDEVVELTVAGFGSVRRALTDAPTEVVTAVKAALIRALAPLHDGTGVRLEGAIAIITARRRS
jgi:SAM-dependent methyltransferase